VVLEQREHAARRRAFGFNSAAGSATAQKSRGTENIVYYGKTAAKLARVRISHGRTCSSPGGWSRRTAASTPSSRRSTTGTPQQSAVCQQSLPSDVRQFSGKFVTDEGEAVFFADIPGFAEHAVNRWSPILFPEPQQRLFSVFA
jgi:hypothetical protein